MFIHQKFRRHLLSTAALMALAPAAFAADYAFTAGTYAGPSPIAAGDTLTLGTGGYKYLNSTLANNGTIQASDDLYFQSGNVLSNAGLFNWKNDSGFYDGGYNGGFANSGTLRKSGGTGTSFVQISGFSNSGTVDVQTGTINFNSGAVFNAGSAFTGAGSAVVSNGATFNGAFSSQNLALTGGVFTGDHAALSGSVGWTGGQLDGSWTVGAGQALTLSAGSFKYVNGSVANNGSIVTTDNLYFRGGNVLSNAGLFELKGDVGLYDGGYNGGVVNAGTLRKSSGAGTSFVSISGFTSSGTVEAQTGTINFNTGASFSNGTQFTGLGQIVISNGASMAGTYTTAGNLTFSGGTFTGTGAVINGGTTWSGGSLVGDWTVGATRTLTLATGGYKYIDGAVTNNGTIVAGDDLYFASGNTLANRGLFDVKGDFALLDGGYNGNFINDGTYRKSAGTGTSNVGITGFTNNGTVDARAGTINFTSGAVFNAGSAFTGAGQVVVSNGATFNGAYTTAGNLTLAGGTYTGNGAKMAGDTAMTSGTLAGTWEVVAGKTLALLADGYKYLNGTLVNNGSIVASDTLYLQSGNTLTNNGTTTFKGDVGLADGGYNGNFVNNGTLRKSDGIGTSTVGITGFTNNGVIDAQRGTIAFTAGAQFNNGSQFTGAGQVVVSNGANFAGGFSTAHNLTLSGGTFNGSSTAPATLTAGAVTWTGGSLTGDWQTASGSTLNIDAGGTKYINGSVTTGGHTVATDTVYLQNGHVFTNTGVYEVKGNVGLSDGGYNGQFVNSGTFLKSTGGGLTDVSAIAFSNPGTVDVRSGTIALPANFANPGTVTGTGALTTNLLTNTGHVAPGTGAGTLTLNGNFAQTASGFMDIELASSTSFDEFLVNGTAALHGTLALSCIASCALHTGDVFTILDATGDLSGTFDSVTTAGFTAGFGYSVVYDYADDAVKLMVLDAGMPITAAVPEPGTWALLLAGLGMTGVLARRRKPRE